MNFNYKWLVAAFIGFGLISCESDDDNGGDMAVELTAGSANFSTFVAVGNSLTAGFTDNALFIAGQENSMPNILAQKFAMVGGGNFVQPLMSDNTGGVLAGGNQILSNRLFFNGAGPAVLPGTPTTDIAVNNPTGPFNNMGVPGARSFELAFPGYGNIANLPNANPFFVRMASTPNATVIGDAAAQNPTFFTLWIGANDVLRYATGGGAAMDQTGNLDPTTYGPSDITDPNVFASTYAQLLGALTANGAQGVTANIPNVASLPYFTTVPYNPLSPENPDFGPQIPTLNGIFGQLNLVFAALGQADRSIVFDPNGPSPVVVRDEDLANLAPQITGALNASPTFPAFVQSFGLPPQAAPLVAALLGNTYGQARQATANDLLVLPSSTVIGTVNEDVETALIMQGLPAALAGQFAAEGITLPLEDKWVLTPEEQAAVTTATNAYNAAINAAAGQAGIPVVDMNSRLTELAAEGINFDGFNLASALVFGGAFSLDGVHPNSRGYAFVANEFLKVIDATYGSNFEAAGALASANDFPITYGPALQ